MAVESHDKKLDDLLKMVEEGKAQLPDFQRSWVWDDTNIWLPNGCSDVFG